MTATCIREENLRTKLQYDQKELRQVKYFFKLHFYIYLEISGSEIWKVSKRTSTTAEKR